MLSEGGVKGWGRSQAQENTQTGVFLVLSVGDNTIDVWLDGEGTNTKSTPKWAHFWCSAPCRIEEHQTDMTGRGDPPRRVKESQTDTTGRVSPLVTSNRTHRRNGEGLSSSLRPMNSNRRDGEGEPSPSHSVE